MTCVKPSTNFRSKKKCNVEGRWKWEEKGTSFLYHAFNLRVLWPGTSLRGVRTLTARGNEVELISPPARRMRSLTCARAMQHVHSAAENAARCLQNCADGCCRRRLDPRQQVPTGAATAAVWVCKGKPLGARRPWSALPAAKWRPHVCCV